MSGRSIRIGRMEATPCPGTTSSTACRGQPFVGFGYREELERFAAEVPWFKYVATISRPWEDAAWKGETGRVDDLVRKYIEQWGLRPETTTGYLCGHPSMCENGQGILQRAG